MRPRAAEAFGVVIALRRVERAFADGRLLQRPLIENPVDVAADRRPRLRRHCRMVFRLLLPDRVELGEGHLPGRIKIIFRLCPGAAVAGADGFALLMPPMQELAERARAGALDLDLQPGCRLADRPQLAVLFFGLAVGQKPAPLVQVKQCPADMIGRQFLVERPGAQLERVEPLQPFAFRQVLRHQAVLDQQGHHVRSAFQIPVAPPPCPARDPPRHRVRALRLRIAPVRVDAHAARAQPHRPALAIEAHHEPAERIRPDIEPEPIREFVVRHRLSYFTAR